MTDNDDPVTQTLPMRSLLVVPAALFLLAGCGGGGDGDAAAPAPETVTVTETQTVTAGPEEPEPVTGDNLPRPRDFKLGVKIREKTCYGSGVGCNVTFQIEAKGYTGSVDISEASLDITYEVLGGSNGPQINTLQLKPGGTLSVDTEEFIETPAESTQLEVRVTDVNEA